jgi:hypothetical protein
VKPTTPKVAEPFFVRKQFTTLEEKEKNIAQSKYMREIRCFRCQGLEHYAYKCLNKKIMVIKDDSEVELISDDDLEGVPNLFFFGSKCKYINRLKIYSAGEPASSYTMIYKNREPTP